MGSVAMTYISNYTSFCLIIFIIHEISIKMVLTLYCFLKGKKS